MPAYACRRIMREMHNLYRVEYGVGKQSLLLPRTESEAANSWFRCPFCDKKIYLEDWDILTDNFICPHCQEIL